MRTLPPALSSEALFAKSRVFILKALRRKEEGDFEEYQLWASLSLELLGKSILASIHPSLVADPTHYQSLFAASGINLSTDLKTIAAHTLFDRLRHLSNSFDEKSRLFCSAIAQ